MVGTQERAFSVMAQKLWNSLPWEIHLSSSVNVFHKQVKTFCFTWHTAQLQKDPPSSDVGFHVFNIYNFDVIFNCLNILKLIPYVLCLAGKAA